MKDRRQPPEQPKRITFPSLVEALVNAFNLDRGLGFTLMSMLLQPGKAIREYLFEDRTRMVHPLRFLLLSTAIAGFLGVQFLIDKQSMKIGFEQGVHVEAPSDVEGREEFSAAVQQEIFTMIFDIFTKYQNLILLLSVPLFALSSRVFFYRRKLYFGEHLAVSAYVVSLQNVIFIIMIPIELWFGFGVTAYIGLSIISACYVYLRFYSSNHFRGVVSSILVPLTAMTLYILLLSVGILVLVVLVARERGLF